MKKLFNSILIAFILTGCATDYYGHTKEEWNKLTKQQRKEATENIKTLKEQQHDREISNKFINDLFGTRSNKF